MRVVGVKAVLLGVVWVFIPLDGTAVGENKPHSSSLGSLAAELSERTR